MNDIVFRDGSAVRREEWSGLWRATRIDGDAIGIPDEARGGCPIPLLFPSAQDAAAALHQAGYGRGGVVTSTPEAA